MVSKSIAIVDLSPIYPLMASTENSDANWEKVAREFQIALSSHGFTFIVNHNIPDVKVEKVFQASKQFFRLPRETKAKYNCDPEKHFHGYTHKELKSNEIQELRESFDCAGTQRFYPNEVPEFGPILEDLEKDAKEVLKILLRLLAKALELKDESYFLKSSKYLNDSSISSFSNFRTLYYPAIESSVTIPSETLRTNEHTDYGLITLLIQDEIGGLEIKTKDGKWKAIEPLKNAILINAGDLLEFWTGGLIPATPHRVLIPEEDDKKKLDRQCVAYFVHPDDDAVISPIQSDLIHYGKLFEPVTASEYATMKLELVTAKDVY